MAVNLDYFAEVEALGITLDASTKQRILDAVTQLVSRARYKVIFAVLDVQSGVATYALPSVDVDGNAIPDGAELSAVYHVPGLTALLEPEADAGLDVDYWARVLADAAWRSRAKRWGWERLSATHIQLVPTPSADAQIVLEYHVPLPTDEFTAAEFELVRLGCTAYALQHQAMHMTTSSGWSAGSLSVRYNAAQVEHVSNRAAEYMERFRRALDHDGIA